jgi:hypothetical protein
MSPSSNDLYVKTRWSPQATMTVEESAIGIVNVVFGLTTKDNGAFLGVLNMRRNPLTCSTTERNTLGEGPIAFKISGLQFIIRMSIIKIKLL